MDEENKLPEPTIADLKEQIEEVTVQRDEYLAGWQRAKADFINYKKEEANRAIEVARYGSADLIKDLISVMDNFDLALRTLEKAGPVEKGIYLIRCVRSRNGGSARGGRVRKTGRCRGGGD